MALAKDEKQQIIQKYRIGKQDVGSPEVQVALLTRRIATLTDHFKGNAKDHQSRRGLLKMVARRRKLLSYLKRTGPQRYAGLVGNLGIRH
ncbi:MAG: 30S ribosomal protein S15 [Bryobacteraceae bacterium]